MPDLPRHSVSVTGVAEPEQVRAQRPDATVILLLPPHLVLATVLTGPGAKTGTGITATATGYVSDAVRMAMPNARVLPLVVECGTLDGPAVMEAVQADNWLHLFGKIA